jgi:GntR family transcriptional regulator
MARYRLELGPVPLHHQVYLDLRASLDDGTWRPGSRLPTERELAAAYGCSLITIRHALSELVHEGRIERMRGRGTTVLLPPIEHEPADKLTFTAEMTRQGLTPSTRLETARPEAAGEVVAAALGLEPGSPALYIERLRLANAEPVLLERAYLSAERFPGLLAHDLEHGSLYQLLEDRYGTHVARTRESLRPVLLEAREARLLKQDRRTPALLIEGIATTADDRPVEFSRTYVRGDRTRYSVERAVVRSPRSGQEEERAMEERAGQKDGPAPVGRPITGTSLEEPRHAR